LKIIRSRRKPVYDDQLNKMFHLFWNGTKEDEIYAWYKVRSILGSRGEGESKKIEYVNRKISELNKQGLYARTTVTDDGRLVEDGEEDEHTDRYTDRDTDH
ncbi:MAG: hypothetical protein R3211_07855, partial [Balneolaceae bacterium]|nr:hypothetical protein [Balneolaceae bacterium]